MTDEAKEKPVDSEPRSQGLNQNSMQAKDSDPGTEQHLDPLSATDQGKEPNKKPEVDQLDAIVPCFIDTPIDDTTLDNIEQRHRGWQQDILNTKKKSASGRAIFDQLDIENVNFSKRQFPYATFREAKAKNCDFSHANLKRCKFLKADCVGADFSYANLQGADFSRAHLENCNFEGANLQGCNFNYTHVSEEIKQRTQTSTSSATNANDHVDGSGDHTSSSSPESHSDPKSHQKNSQTQSPSI